MNEDHAEVPSVLETRGDGLTSIWLVIGVFGAMFGLFFTIVTPTPGHEQVVPIIRAMVTLSYAVGILGLTRAILGGPTVLIVFSVIVPASCWILYQLVVLEKATMPGWLKPLDIYDWILLFAFSVFVLIGHRRFIPDP